MAFALSFSTNNPCIQEWNVAYKRRVVSVAVSRKKKVAVDAISNVVKGVFP